MNSYKRVQTASKQNHVMALPGGYSHTEKRSHGAMQHLWLRSSGVPSSKRRKRPIAHRSGGANHREGWPPVPSSPISPASRPSCWRSVPTSLMSAAWTRR
eukprot:916330-Amphidinium_carterae.1